MAQIMLNEKNILDYMKRNKCSREEAIDLIKYDNDVESNEATEYDLTPEQEKNVRSMNRKVEHKKGSVKRERKPNEAKEALIIALADFVENELEFTLNSQVFYCGDVEITNKNRMISFSVGEKHYDLTLIEKRTPKK